MGGSPSPTGSLFCDQGFPSGPKQAGPKASQFRGEASARCSPPEAGPGSRGLREKSPRRRKPARIPAAFCWLHIPLSPPPLRCLSSREAPSPAPLPWKDLRALEPDILLNRGARDPVKCQPPLSNAAISFLASFSSCNLCRIRTNVSLLLEHSTMHLATDHWRSSLGHRQQTEMTRKPGEREGQATRAFPRPSES